MEFVLFAYVLIMHVSYYSNPRNLSLSLHCCPSLQLLMPFVQCNIVARLPKECCSQVTETHSPTVVELHVAVSYVKILVVAQQCFCDKFMSPATIKLTHVFM
jgi:hypothetical protein